MLNKKFIEFLYEAAHIQRWNDHIRPNGFTELDKQAHKMIILYILARYEEEDHGVTLDWRALIEGGIAEFLHRIVLTDIKPPVFHQLMKYHGHELNQWVYEQLSERIPGFDQEFLPAMQRYLDNHTYKTKEKRLLRAAHYMASQWEFNIIYPFNKGIYGIEKTKEEINNEIENHYDLAGVQKLRLHGKTSKFVDLVGQLRFQKRWSQSPRVPETSVMGHVLIVAILAYFCSIQIGADDDRLVNNFLCGLFHDLPEVLTRDIISPVKSSVSGLDVLIKDIERKQVDEKILPLLPDSWADDIEYYTQNEFADKYMIGSEMFTFPSEEALNAAIEAHRGEVHKVVDGEILKGCDHLAAFVEAFLSLEHGISSKHLTSAIRDLKAKYTGRVIGGVDFGSIYDQFKPRDNWFEE
ncbi:MAG: HD domain-containing protein [Succiniclasticum sp.]|jgi:putative hydrolase of HD superfamily|nr:HD domain-containing protein [Succiniclasticum sp.]MEE3479469.1 HD domain-containing protein [Succiniclasticum sp.]